MAWMTPYGPSSVPPMPGTVWAGPNTLPAPQPPPTAADYAYWQSVYDANRWQGPGLPPHLYQPTYPVFGNPSGPPVTNPNLYDKDGNYRGPILASVGGNQFTGAGGTTYNIPGWQEQAQQAPAPKQGPSQSQGGPASTPGESRPAPAQPQPSRGTFGYGQVSQAPTVGPAPQAAAWGVAPGQAAFQNATMPGAPPPPPLPPQQQMINPQAHQVVMNAQPTNPLMQSIQGAMQAPTFEQFNPWRRRQGWT